MKNRGKIIREAIEKSGINKTTVAQRLGMSRAGLYKWFDIPNLGWDKIFDLGKVINHDFSNDFPELNKPTSTVKEPLVTYSTPNTLEDCQSQLNEYKEKFIVMVEENKNLWKQIAMMRSGEAVSASFQGRAV